MNKFLIELFPYIVVTVVFIIAFAFGKTTKKKAIRMSNIEVEKAEVFKQLLDIEFEYTKLAKKDQLDNFPLIKKSLKEVTMIIKNVGFNLNLNNVTIIPITKATVEQIDEIEKMLGELEEAPDEIKELLKAKIKLVNKMAILKSPMRHVLDKLSTAVQMRGIKILVSILSLVLRILISLDKIINKPQKNTKPIEDPYFAIGKMILT